MALKLPTKIFLFLQKMNLRTLYFKPIVAKTLAHTLYPTAIWDEVWEVVFFVQKWYMLSILDQTAISVIAGAVGCLVKCVSHLNTISQFVKLLMILSLLYESSKRQIIKIKIWLFLTHTNCSM